jgi:uncharacterized protein DUF6572
MSIEQTDMVDAIGVETETGVVILTVSDHLGWENEARHLLTLQEKLNAYLRFIESGELQEVYPDAKGRTTVIDVVMRLPLSSGAKRFFEVVTPIVRKAGVELRARVLSETTS